MLNEKKLDEVIKYWILQVYLYMEEYEDLEEYCIAFKKKILECLEEL